MWAGRNSATKQQTNSYKIPIPGGPMSIIFPRKDEAIAIMAQHSTTQQNSQRHDAKNDFKN